MDQEVRQQWPYMNKCPAMHATYTQYVHVMSLLQHCYIRMCLMNDSCHTTVRILNFVGKIFVVCQKKLICKCIKFRGYKFSWLVLSGN